MQSLFKTGIEKQKDVAVIAEIKFASPSEGKLGSPNGFVQRIKSYEAFGASAISIVVEKERFNGDPKFVLKARQYTKLPILMKDFMTRQDQIYKASKYRPDALLLIARLVSQKDLKRFVDLCFELRIEPVVEIFNLDDLKKAIGTKTRIIAVNARDLNTFKVDVDRACRLLKKIPDRFLKLGFSGVKGREEVEAYKKAGAKAVLVGTSLMRSSGSHAKFFLTAVRRTLTVNNITGANAPAKNLYASPYLAIQVKICATRSLKSAKVAVEQGAEFLGMVFTPRVKAHTVNTDVAKKIGREMKGKINLVGVFQNIPLKTVQKIIKDCNLDYAQFHGDESPEYLDEIKIKKIKAFRFAGDFDLEEARRQMEKFKVDYYLVDRIKQSEGPMLNLEKVRSLAREFPLIFAGGLTPDNVSDVIKKVMPLIVDVASGVETNGKQDLEKIREFIKNTKNASLLKARGSFDSLRSLRMTSAIGKENQ